MDIPESAKRFGLKPNERILIQAETDRHRVALSQITSFIAVERLAYPVDENTVFVMNDQMTEMAIWQNSKPASKPIDLGEPQATK